MAKMGTVSGPTSPSSPEILRHGCGQSLAEPSALNVLAETERFPLFVEQVTWSSQREECRGEAGGKRRPEVEDGKEEIGGKAGSGGQWRGEPGDRRRQMRGGEEGKQEEAEGGTARGTGDLLERWMLDL